MNSFLRLAVLSFFLSRLPAGTAFAQRVTTFGGSETCSIWFSTKDSYTAGYTWILGFWTGLNVHSSLENERATIGSTMTASDIIDEITKMCNVDKSIRVDIATFALWSRTKAYGR